MPRYEIRSSSPDDLDALRDIFWRASWSNEGDREVISANRDTIGLDEANVCEGRTRVALVDRVAVGFATLLFDDGAELEDLFVDPDWMRRGVGRALVADAVEIARAHDATRIEVTGNDHAREFYASVGFEVDGTVTTPLGPLARRMHLDVR
jgi:GNAT superfamily N-acetyltransferase